VPPREARIYSAPYDGMITLRFTRALAYTVKYIADDDNRYVANGESPLIFRTV
jgi:hypothetical protein